MQILRVFLPLLQPCVYRLYGLLQRLLVMPFPCDPFEPFCLGLAVQLLPQILQMMDLRIFGNVPLYVEGLYHPRHFFPDLAS